MKCWKIFEKKQKLKDCGSQKIQSIKCNLENNTKELEQTLLTEIKYSCYCVVPVIADSIVEAVVVGSSNSLQFFSQQVRVKPGGDRQHPASVTPHIDVHLWHLSEIQLCRIHRRHISSHASTHHMSDTSDTKHSSTNRHDSKEELTERQSSVRFPQSDRTAALTPS